MSARACGRVLLAALLLGAVHPAPGLAVPKVADKDGVVFGIVRGASGFSIRVFIADGPFLVPIRVEPNDLVGPNIGFFKSTDCTGTPYIDPGNAERGVNGINGRMYVTKGNNSRLYRTRTNPTTVDVDIESRWDHDLGGCELHEEGPGTAPYYPASIYLRTLEADFPPPYSLVGTP